MEFTHHVYILRCSNGTWYTGCTNDLDDRLVRHSKGMVQYTSDKLPVECICAMGFQDKYKAFNFEKYLKTGSGRAFMRRHFV